MLVSISFKHVSRLYVPLSDRVRDISLVLPELIQYLCIHGFPCQQHMFLYRCIKTDAIPQSLFGVADTKYLPNKHSIFGKSGGRV